MGRYALNAPVNCWLLRPFDFENMVVGLWGDTLSELRKDICAIEILDRITQVGVKVEYDH